MPHRIHSKNKPILQLPSSHPARRALEQHLECRFQCVGRELGDVAPAIDQEWYSAVRGRNYSFSAFAYEVISFDLILHGWVTHPPELAEDEKWWLDVSPHLRAQIDECLAASEADGNTEIIELVGMVNEWFDLMDESVRLRVREDRVPVTPPLT
jgi:hypothetical protein